MESCAAYLSGACEGSAYCQIYGTAGTLCTHTCESDADCQGGPIGRTARGCNGHAPRFCKSP
jgi:hypothetical protein